MTTSMEDMTVEFRFVILGAGSIAVKLADAVRKTRNCSLLDLSMDFLYNTAEGGMKP